MTFRIKFLEAVGRNTEPLVVFEVIKYWVCVLLSGTSELYSRIQFQACHMLKEVSNLCLAFDSREGEIKFVECLVCVRGLSALF